MTDESLQRAVAKALENFPPLTQAQKDKIWCILHPEHPLQPRELTPYEIEQRRLENERRRARNEAIAEAKRLSDAMLACDVCNLPPIAHTMQQRDGIFHDWEPGRAQKIMDGDS